MYSILCTCYASVLKVMKYLSFFVLTPSQLTRFPLSADVLQPGVADLLELEQHRVVGVRVESADARPDHRKHHAARLGHDHLVGHPVKLLPQGNVLEVNLDSRMAN